MPFVINGIGTWYYGKRHIHAHSGTCEFCGNHGTLSSYDTTLFFVVVFVPLLPLGRKRILKECPYCRKHRVLGLDQWEQAKAADVAAALDRLRGDPGNRDAASQAVALAASYQDEPLFKQILEMTGGALRRDALFQAQLGDTYGFFARWPDAEQAYRVSLDSHDHESVREALAWTLLKQGRPQEAKSYLKHILNDKKQQSAGMIFYLINAYQAEGLHDEALALIDARDKAFPEQAILKECQQQRKTSTRYRATLKKIRAASLVEGAGAGYREGNWTAHLPRWIAALVVLGALGGYFGTAFYLGQARKVFLVNGTGRAYNVSIAGQTHNLAPGTKAIRVPEGDIEATFDDAKLGFAPIQAHIETSFWTRPFVSHAFVINPDQAALIVHEEIFFAEVNPPPGRAIGVYFGQSFYQFSGLDYVFEQPPQTLQVNKGQTVSKTRVAFLPALNDDMRLNLVLQRIPAPEQADFCERLLRIDPTNTLMLHWLSAKREPAQMLKLVETRLGDRPILVEWHRAYQSLLERIEPAADLRPRYEKLRAELPGNPDVVYLLGRVEPDLDKMDQLYRQAAQADPPSGYALYALGYRALSEGRFPQAVDWLDQAMKRLADKTLVNDVYHDALFAARDYDRLAKEAQSKVDVGSRAVMIRMYAVRGEKEKARAALTQAVQSMAPAQQPAMRAMLESALCCWESDVEGYLAKTVAGASFEASFLLGDFQQAARLIDPQPPRDAESFHALLYLEATRSGDKARADVHWQGLLSMLKRAGREERRFAEGLAAAELPKDFPWQRLALDPRSKRVLLAVLAQRHPNQASAILELARRLDFHHDAISLCLRKVLPSAAK